MCRLQFSEPSAQPFSEAHDAEFEDDALEALLALRTDHGMDFKLSEEAALPNVDAAAAEAFQQSGLTNAGKDSSRYHCPFPGCKRSFQELWRLKVHYRAPPNIRGSGKERGHGMRLTHCPKCGAALKVGGHHVKCAAVPKEPAAGNGANGRRNRKNAVPRADAAAAAAAAAVYAEPSYQQSQTAPTVGTAAAAAAAASSRGSPYMQYGLSEMLQHADAAGDGQSLWQRALALQAQQQQQLSQQQADEYTDEHQASYRPMLAASAPAGKTTAPTPASAAALLRLASSDDSSSSRMMEGSCSGGSGNDTTWGPSSSSGYGSGSEDTDGHQHHQHQQQQPLLSLFGPQPAAAAAELPQRVKHEQVPAAAPEPLQQDQEQAQHPEAGQLLWQHMLLQHLQQHVAQTPGFSLPELIQVASALFGDRVDTLVNAFGLSGPAQGGVTHTGLGQEQQAQQYLAQLVAGGLSQGGVAAAAPAAAAVSAAAGHAVHPGAFAAGMQ